MATVFDFGPYNNTNLNPLGTPDAGVGTTTFVNNLPAYSSPQLTLAQLYASLGLTPPPAPAVVPAPAGPASVAAPGNDIPQSPYFNFTKDEPGGGGTPNPNALFSFANPFYASVIAPILNAEGQQTGTVPLANNQFATPDMAAALLNYLSSQYGLKNGQIVKSTYSGPTAPSEAELGIRFGNSPVINAGLEYQRLQNANGYSQPYLDAQFKDTLAPGSSGWSNYANGGQAMTSADAERMYAGNPATDPNANVLGQAWKYAQTNGTYSGPSQAPQTNTSQPPTSSYPGPGYTGGYSGGYNGYNGSYNYGYNGNNDPWRSWPGSTGFQGYASAMNYRRPPYSGNYSTRQGGYQAPAAPTWTNPATSETGGSYMNTRSMNNSYNRVTANPYGR